MYFFIAAFIAQKSQPVYAEQSERTYDDISQVPIFQLYHQRNVPSFALLKIFDGKAVHEQDRQETSFVLYGRAALYHLLQEYWQANSQENI